MKKILTNIMVAVSTIVATVSATAPALAEGPRVIKMENPKMTAYLPASELANGKAVVVCPGGGYAILATGHEGNHWAPFFNDLGYAAIVLEYSMPKGDRKLPMRDVENCFKAVTDSAAVWNINPEKIGIMGSSAGGHIASTMATHPSGICKPAFQILFYPVISLEKEITHTGTANGFLGKDASDKLRKEWSSYNNVTPTTPPAFITVSANDKGVLPENSIRYFEALNKAGVSVSMHIYPTGGHGWGYRKNKKALPERSLMLSELAYWLTHLD